MTSAPPLKTGFATPSGDLGGERKPLHPPLVADLMSVSFAVSVHSAGGSVDEADARRVRMARMVTAARLRYCGLDTLIDDAVLIVSELVTNAILHSDGTQVTFTMAVRDNVLHLAVHDEVPGRPAACHADSESEHGRGLFLVDALAREHGGKWGSTNEGATIFCDLALTGVSQ